MCLQHALLVQCHLGAWTNRGSSLRSSTLVQRSVATHGARGTTELADAAAAQATHRWGGAT
jgi:hypothetical protein